MLWVSVEMTMSFAPTSTRLTAHLIHREPAGRVDALGDLGHLLVAPPGPHHLIGPRTERHAHHRGVADDTQRLGSDAAQLVDVLARERAHPRPGNVAAQRAWFRARPSRTRRIRRCPDPRESCWQSSRCRSRRPRRRTAPPGAVGRTSAGATGSTAPRRTASRGSLRRRKTSRSSASRAGRPTSP